MSAAKFIFIFQLIVGYLTIILGFFKFTYTIIGFQNTP